MITLQVTVRGDEALNRLLNQGLHLEDEIARGMGHWATGLLDEQLYGEGNYAPPPANSTYIRTGRLGRGWGVMRHDRMGVKFFNMTTYAGYVVGDADGGGQSAIHQGRWWIAYKKVEDGLGGAVDSISHEVVRALT